MKSWVQIQYMAMCGMQGLSWYNHSFIERDVKPQLLCLIIRSAGLFDINLVTLLDS